MNEGERYLCLGHVPYPSINPTLEQMHLRQNMLIIQPLQFRQQPLHKAQRQPILFRIQIQPRQSRLKTMFQEDPFLGFGPGDVFEEGLFEDFRGGGGRGGGDGGEEV